MEYNEPAPYAQNFTNTLPPYSAGLTLVDVLFQISSPTYGDSDAWLDGIVEALLEAFAKHPNWRMRTFFISVHGNWEPGSSYRRRKNPLAICMFVATAGT